MARHGADRALGVVLVRGRRAEERHHRVADELLDGAAVALELGADALVVRAEERLDVLGVELLGPLREADEVAEDDRDDLALSAWLARAMVQRVRRERASNLDLMARIKDSSVRDVTAAADMVEVVSGRTQLRRASGSRFTGRCPVPRGADAELLGEPRRQALLLLRLREGRRSHLLRTRDREPRLRGRDGVARRALPGAARVRGVVAARRGRSPSPRAPVRRPGADDGVLRASALGGRYRRAGARLPRRAGSRGGDHARVPARALTGSRASPRRLPRRGSRRTSCAGRGSRRCAEATTSRSG